MEDGLEEERLWAGRQPIEMTAIIQVRGDETRMEQWERHKERMGEKMARMVGERTELGN